MPHTDLMDLTPLPKTALHNHQYEGLYNFDTFNPIQTQLFHILYHTDLSVLLGAPTGSGKTIVAELALLRLKATNPNKKCVYIAPLKSLARERLKEWRKKLSPLKWNVLELSGDTHHDARALNRADVLVCTPEKWDLMTRGWKGGQRSDYGEHAQKHRDGKRFVTDVGLLVIDEIHLLGEERGAVLEAIVSRTRYISQYVKQNSMAQGGTSGGNKNTDGGDAIIPTRIIGLSTALANPTDLADWMGIDVSSSGTTDNNHLGLYNFRPSVRPIPMEVHIQGYPGRHYCPRMASMNKPCYAAIKQHSPSQPVIIFVASRRQTRLTALDIISYAAGDENPRAFLGSNTDDVYIESLATSAVSDEALKHTMTFGVGLHHAGLSSKDRDVVEELFLKGDILVLVATATLAWGVNLPAHLVIVKGTEFYDGKTSRYVDYPVTDVLQMMGRAGRPQFDTHGIAVVMVAEDKKNFYKKFLYDPFPVESCLAGRLCENINAEISIGTIGNVSDALGYLDWTFYARRVRKNPSYYGATVTEADGEAATSTDENYIEEFLLRKIQETLKALEKCQCVTIDRNGSVGNDYAMKPTVLGNAACKFYLQYQTPIQMRDGVRAARKKMLKLLDTWEQATGKTIDSSPWIPNDIESTAVAHILLVLSQTHEFDELPVRHNEEIMNADLCDALPWGVDERGVLGQKNCGAEIRGGDDDIFADPHTKCFLLLQAFLAKAALPISDYINDTKSVLDQVPRLLAAMQFICLEDVAAGSFDIFCLFAKVRQVLEQRIMPDTDPLDQIPGIPKDGTKRLKSRTNGATLQQLRAMPQPELFDTLKAIMGGKKKNSLNKATKFIQGLPLISFEKISVKCEIEKTSGKSIGHLKFTLLLDSKLVNQSGRGKGNDKGLTYMVALGTPRGRSLLAQTNVTSSTLTGGELKKTIEMGFDWGMANAGGGTDGGSMLLRVLCENVRGMDVEHLVPLH